MKQILVVMLLLVAVPVLAQDTPEEPIPTPAPKLMSTGGDLKNALDECKSHPSVVAAGTPLEVCMDAYGFVKSPEGKWVQKPATR